MGILLDALRLETEIAPVAKVANPANRPARSAENSQDSRDSQFAAPETRKPLPNFCASADDAGAFDERAAIAEFDGKLPRAHAETLAALQTMPRPASVTEKQMAEIIDLTARRLDAALRKRITP